ncbi:hypothetical protein IJH89_01015 [Candidatus Saccharibacteria bacterium]|nr:hypothetical protein [Candidatus Saccharibacteria bacterium]
MKRINLFLVTLLLSLFFSPLAFAEEEPVGSDSSAEKTSETKALSEEARASISENCGSIRNSLKAVQRSDSRARTYFGSIYETVSSKYITPLNLRLVKNDLSNVSLINLQTSLSTYRADFSSDFIDYSKSLEELILIDCRLEPELFYNQLLSTRKKRKKVATDMKSINDTLVSSVKTVEKYKDSLDASSEK